MHFQLPYVTMVTPVSCPNRKPNSWFLTCSKHDGSHDRKSPRGALVKVLVLVSMLLTDYVSEPSLASVSVASAGLSVVTRSVGW